MSVNIYNICKCLSELSELSTEGLCIVLRVNYTFTKEETRAQRDEDTRSHAADKWQTGT